MFFDLEHKELGYMSSFAVVNNPTLTMFLGRRFNNDVKMAFVLMSMYGFSRWFVERVFCRFCLSWNVRVFEIPDALLTGVEDLIIFSEGLLFGRLLRNYVKGCIERRMTLKVYRGLRFLQSLPMRGQRSKTNARTMKKMGRKVFLGLNINRKF